MKRIVMAVFDAVLDVSLAAGGAEVDACDQRAHERTDQGVLSGGAAADPNLRGWAAILRLEPGVLQEALREAGINLIRGERGAIALGTLSKLWVASRSFFFKQKTAYEMIW